MAAGSAAWVSTQPAIAQSASRFSAILVTGNQGVPSDTVVALSGLDIGSPIEPFEINDALRRLYATGLFSFVDIRVAAGRIVIEVAENQSIALVSFEGNRSLNNAALARVVESQARGRFDRATAEADARRIARLYAESSNYSARVEPRVIPLPDGRVNLVFEVTEGRVGEIQSINFVGNSTFTEGRLRRAITSREAGLLSGLAVRDNFTAARVRADEDALLRFYRDQGFVDAAVRATTSEFTTGREGFFLTYVVTEGGRFNFGTASVASTLGAVDAGQFSSLVRIRGGQRYQASQVEDTVDAIEAEALRRGMPFVRAVPRLIKNEASGTVDVVFELVEGNRIFVERIDIRGNNQTIDRVIRREFRFGEGDAFNQRKLREAERALRALGYFNNVSVTLREGSGSDRAIIEVEVEDAPTGSLSFGASYSTDSGLSGLFSLSERNFLGRGQRVDFNVSAGESSTVAGFSFTEPRLFDRDLAVGFDVNYRDANRAESSFQTTTWGVATRLGFPVDENTRFTLRYNFSSEEIRDTVLGETSLIIIADEGIALTSSIGFDLTHDRRDSAFSPANGYILQLRGDYAGLGGDAGYIKAVARAKGYLGLFDDQVVLSADLEAGGLFLNDPAGTSRVTDRFFLGGSNFRGFAPGGVGPRDDDGGPVNDSLGGNYYAIARLDAVFPLGLPADLGIRGGAFVDAGSVWDLGNVGAGDSGVIDDSFQLRATAGFALYWNTGIGPLVFNWAYPIETVEGDVTQTFSVSIRTTF